VNPLPPHELVALPAQPDGVGWPTHEWPEADPAELGADTARLTALLDELVSGEPHPDHGLSYAAAVVAGGRLVAERYGRRVVQDLRSLEPDPPHEDVTAESMLLSWSMAKSITNLAVGTAVADGRLRIDEPVLDPRWTTTPGDPRAAITWEHLLTMRPGLAWTEEYYDLEVGSMPDVVTMLFGEGAVDVAAFAADKDLVAEPGSPEAYVYSSGTTNIIAAALQRTLGLDAEAMDAYLHERIFDPIGMASAVAQFDPAGTFIGSSYVHATLRDWCRFGLLALRGGTWDGQPLVPEGWVDWSRTARSWDETVLHGAQWWAWDAPETPFGAHGFEGQRVIAFPARDVVVLRFGKAGPDDTPALNAHLTEIARCFPER
jgi:CubicO group peptidase (beta-lactamase class C family)